MNRFQNHKKPKKPIRLQFGLIEEEKAPIVEKKEEYQYVQQKLTGHLYAQNTKIDPKKVIEPDHFERMKKNLEKILASGKLSQSKMNIDSSNPDELLVSFPYDVKLVERFRGLDRTERQWDPEAKVWRVFIGAFDDIFDVLQQGFKLTDSAYENLLSFIQTPYYAHISPSKEAKLIVRESWFETFATKVIVEEPLSKNVEDCLTHLKTYAFKRNPFSHQLSGIELLLKHPSFALLDEMGCGKSFQIASAVSLLIEHRVIDYCIIVAPKSLVRTWEEEIVQGSNLPFVTIRGTQSKREQAFLKKAPIYILHYEAMKIEEKKIAELLRTGKGMLVFDESQRVKNPESQTTRAAIRLRKIARRCVISTGTLIANRPLDIFAQFQVMDNGNTFGTNFQKFKNTFCLMEPYEIRQGRRTIRVEKFVGIKNSEELKRLIYLHAIRRLKSEVLDLPPVIYKDYLVELTGEQKTMYAQMRDFLKVEVQGMSEDQIIAEASNIFVKLLRLSQIASNPGLIDPHYAGPQAKLEELDDLLNDVLAQDNKKVIIWTHFVENVETIKNRIEEKWGMIATHTGEMSIDARQENIELFRTQADCRVFVATPQSAKEGLTLTPRDPSQVTDTMIYMDLNFDGGSYLQSQARFHRIGQTAEKCLVIHLLGDQTVDLYIKKSLIDKIKMASLLLDKEKEAAFDTLKTYSHRSLTKSSIIDLLSDPSASS